jgi:hypothetical protein
MKLELFMPLKKVAICLTVMFLCSCAGMNFSKKKSKVNHVVLCWLKDKGNQEQRRLLIEQSLKFEDIPGVLEVRAGEVLKSTRPIVDSSYDVAIFLSFSSVEDMQAYIVHPKHEAAVQSIIKPLVKKVLVYDFVESP